MQINDKITELKKALPLGSYKEIAERIGVSPHTVKNVFELKQCRLKTTMAVIKEASNIITEYNETIDEAVTQISSHEKSKIKN